MLKRLILVNLFTLLCGVTMIAAAAQPAGVTLRSLFVDSQCPALDVMSKDDRMDMFDYAEDHVDYAVINNFYGESSILSYFPDMLKIKLSQVSEAQLFVLPLGKQNIGFIIYTINAGGADSQMFVYNGKWQQLKTLKFFTPPVLADFVAPRWRKDKEVMQSIEESVPFTTMRYEYDFENKQLTVYLTVKHILSEEACEHLDKYLIKDNKEDEPSLKYVWNGKRFTLME